MSIISHADYLATGCDERGEGHGGRVFSCEVCVSSSLVWEWEAAVCVLRLYTPAGVSAPVPEAARHTAAPPKGRRAPLEDCNSLEKEKKYM